MSNGIYSQKVIEHFQNPHNYGRIKNPDGVGKVGNIVCLLPHQNIHTNNNLKEINRISKKDKVLSYNGRYNSVGKIVKGNYNGKILSIKNKLGTIDLTPDHLISAIKIPKRDKFLYTKNRKKLTSAWYHAEQLENGDIVLYPILREEKNLEDIEINIPKPKWDFRSIEIPNKTPVNPEFLRLVGYFLSEGNIQDRPCSTFITFTLNIKEKDIVEDIKKISKNLFGLDIVARERKNVKTVVVYLYSARLARFFKKLFGNGTEYKKLPDFIMNLPAEKQKSLIYGLWRGDGYVSLNRDGPRAGYCTISYALAQQIKVLLLRQKIAPSIYINRERKVNGVSHKKAYRIHVGQRDSLLKLCSILKIEYKPRSYHSEKGWFDDNYLYTPITGIKKHNYDGDVYNLEVQNSKSFVSEAFCLHNCGDVMQLYIKIGRNKEDKEVIEDIKFETFGCAAAISTSSIVTDLAKGKTLEEAMSINSNKIVEELGGLPPIKIHCSLLGADALSEAIYDYLTKKKKKIPEELERRHQRLEKEKKEIEERYKKWIK